MKDTALILRPEEVGRGEDPERSSFLDFYSCCRSTGLKVGIGKQRTLAKALDRGRTPCI